MTKDRSPNYPAIGLSEAIELARTLWTKEKRTVIPPEVAAKSLGYKTLSGPVRTKLSALKKYGLLDDDKQGLQVSDLAMLILHPEHPQERQAATQEAAVKPDLFRELLENYQHGSDDALRAHLLRRHFSEAGARHLITAFRDTLAVAKLSGSGYASSKDTKEPETMPTSGLEVRATETIPVTDSSRAAARPRSYSWPLSKDVSVELRIIGDPLTKAEADRLRQYVDLTVSALVADSE